MNTKSSKMDNQNNIPVPGASVGPNLTKPVPSASDPPPVLMPLSAITLDPDLQSRAAVNDDTINLYRVRMIAGDVFPPLVAFQLDGKLVLADGWHRYFGAKAARRTEFLVQVRQGTREDLVRCALTANNTHGRPRTGDDKRRSVALALREFPQMSDRAIAELCKVSQPLVGRVREQMKLCFSSDLRIGRDGKMRKVPQAHAPCAAAGPKMSPHLAEMLANSPLPYVPAISVNTFLVSACHILNEMGGEAKYGGLLRTLDELVDEVQKLTKIPPPKPCDLHRPSGAQPDQESGAAAATLPEQNGAA